MKKLFYFLMMTSLLAFVSCEKNKKEVDVPTVKLGSISGLVTDYANANAPIAGATVTLNTKGLTKTTGSDGRFEFVNIEPGSYTLQVMANNYQATTKQVTVRADQNVNCDFQLDKSSANIDINPMNLSYGKGVSEMSFTIKNNSSNQLTYSISNIPSYLTLTSKSGLIAAKGSQAIVATVTNRSSITESVNSQMLVSIGGESFVINIFVEGTGGSGGGDNPGQGTGGSDDVTRGLLAYFTFDNESATNLKDNTNNGSLRGDNISYITDTPNGKGKALSLGNKEYVKLPKNILDGASAFSISMWVKDFGVGPLFVSTFSDDTWNGSPRLFIDESNYFVADGTEEIYDTAVRFGLKATNYQSSGWHMITATFANSKIYLYIDGSLVDSISHDPQTKGRGTITSIGGVANNIWNNSMKIDNVRIYSVSLTDKEVTSLYKYEK